MRTPLCSTQSTARRCPAPRKEGYTSEPFSGGRDHTKVSLDTTPPETAKSLCDTNGFLMRGPRAASSVSLNMRKLRQPKKPETPKALEHPETQNQKTSVKNKKAPPPPPTAPKATPREPLCGRRPPWRWGGGGGHAPAVGLRVYDDTRKKHIDRN